MVLRDGQDRCRRRRKPMRYHDPRGPAVRAATGTAPLTLTYRDAASEGALAALLAATACPARRLPPIPKACRSSPWPNASPPAKSRC